MLATSAAELYNLPLHEYTRPVVHVTASDVVIPTALPISPSTATGEQLQQIRDFVGNLFERSCFKAGIVLCDDTGDASALEHLRDAFASDEVLCSFQRVFFLTGGALQFAQEFPGLCEAYAEYTAMQEREGGGDMVVFPSKIRSQLYLGSASSAHPFIVRSLGIGAVVNAGASHARMDATFPHSDYLYLDFLDSTAVVLAPYLQDAIEFVDAAVASGKKVFVHCEQGRSRSVSLVVSYLMHSEGLSFDEALDEVRAARPAAQPNYSFVQQLRAFNPRARRVA